MWITLCINMKSEVILNEKNLIVENVDNSVDKLNVGTTIQRDLFVPRNKRKK